MRLGILVLVIMIPLSVMAQNESSLKVHIKQCLTFRNNSDRLKCFDKLAQSQDSPNITYKNRWTVLKETNPIDDSVTAIAILPRDSETNPSIHSVGLILRCTRDKYFVYISWKDYLGTKAIVTYRLDKDKAKIRQWSLSTDSQATFYPYDAKLFIAALSGSNRFVAQVLPYNDSPKTAVFTLKGIQKVAKFLYKTCGDK